MIAKMFKADPEWRWKSAICLILFTLAIAIYFGLTAYLEKQRADAAGVTMPATELIIKPLPRPSKQKFYNTEC